MSQEIKNIVELSHDELNVVTGGYDPSKEYADLNNNGDHFELRNGSPEQVKKLNQSSQAILGIPTTRPRHSN